MDSSQFHCPHCGADVSPNAAICRQCGARKVEGRWADPEIHDGIDLPEEDEFDYEAFLESEFGSGVKRKSGKEVFWWIVAILLLIAFTLMVLPLG